MSKRAVLTFAFVLVAGFAAPLYAQGGRGAALNIEIAKWSIITAGFALGIARRPRGARPGPRGRPRPPKAIARNPGAAGDIRGALLLGLVLIESLAIYVLLISLILFFLQAVLAAGDTVGNASTRAKAAVTRRTREGRRVALRIVPACGDVPSVRAIRSWRRLASAASTRSCS